MTDASFKTNAALSPEPGVLQAKTFTVAVATAVAPKAPCLTCAKEPVVTIPKAEPAHPPTSPTTSPQPIPPTMPRTTAPTVPTSSVLDQELNKLRQDLLNQIVPPSVPATAPSIPPPPSTQPRPIITPAPMLAAPRELLWSQLGVGYVGMQPFARPMINGGLSGMMMTGCRVAILDEGVRRRVVLCGDEAQSWDDVCDKWWQLLQEAEDAAGATLSDALTKNAQDLWRAEQEARAQWLGNETGGSQVDVLREAMDLLDRSDPTTPEWWWRMSHQIDQLRADARSRSILQIQSDAREAYGKRVDAAIAAKEAADEKAYQDYDQDPAVAYAEWMYNLCLAISRH